MGTVSRGESMYAEKSRNKNIITLVGMLIGYVMKLVPETL